MFTKTTNNKENLQNQAVQTIEEAKIRAGHLKNEATEDYNSLKQNVAELAHNAKKTALQAKDQITDELSGRTREGLEKLEDYSNKAMLRVKDKPVESVLWAFGAGILVSLFFGRK